MKSSKNNRLKVIEQAIKDAHQYSLQRCGLPLNKMPEYFLGVTIGQAMVEAFDNFKVRFEMSVQDLINHLDVQASGEPQDRENGRFDLVLLTKSKEIPAHIIEIKRGVKAGNMAADIRRLANICRAAQSGSRLETNYFVTVTARTEKVVSERAEQLMSAFKEAMQNIRLHEPKIISLEHPSGKPVTAAIYEVTYDYG